VDGAVGINVNMATEAGTILEIIGGTIEITITDNKTLLEFNLTTESNKTVKGRFKVVLSEIY